MQSLQQIREEERRGEKLVAAAQAEAGRILAEAHAQEPDIRAKIAAEMDEREEAIAAQTLDEAKRLIAETEKTTAAQITVAEEQARENSQAATDFILGRVLGAQ